MATDDTTIEEEIETNGLSERLRSSLALVPVPQQLRQVPEQLRQVPVQLRSSVKRFVEKAGSRLRATLDIPTGSEVQELLARVEELDRRLEQLQTKDAPKAKAKKPAAKKPAAKKTAAKKTAAKKKPATKAKAKANGKGRVK